MRKNRIIRKEKTYSLVKIAKIPKEEVYKHLSACRISRFYGLPPVEIARKIKVNDAFRYLVELALV